MLFFSASATCQASASVSWLPIVAEKNSTFLRLYNLDVVVEIEWASSVNRKVINYFLTFQ